jgi:hypothetical protein
MRKRWSEEEIWKWYKSCPWITGFNFIPSGSTKGVLWMLQEFEHEQAFKDASKEIALAASLGFNSVRCFHYRFIFGGCSMTAL